MRRPLWLLPLIVAAFGMSLTGCEEYVVTKHYGTLAEYEDHGWLPAELLPASAHHITTINDLDINHSSGEFSFDPREAATFQAQLKPGAPTESPYVNWNKTIKRHDRSGRKAWTHNDGGSLWVFFCDSDKGHCEYDMWSIVSSTAIPTPDASS